MNRRAILERLAQETARAARENSSIGVGVLDIDRFKLINDTYGHGVGDGVLQVVVNRSKAALRSQDALGRTGGDEFLVMLPRAEPSQAESVLERIREAVAQRPVEVAGLQLAVTLSIGGATSRGESAAELVRWADDALYQAKSRGRDQVVMAVRSA